MTRGETKSLPSVDGDEVEDDGVLVRRCFVFSTLDSLCVFTSSVRPTVLVPFSLCFCSPRVLYFWVLSLVS